MLNIGFGEMVVIAGAALIVIGPERLPATARFVGHLYGRLMRQAASVRAEIKKEMDIEDMRRTMRETEQAARQAVEEVREPVAEIADQARLEPEAELAPPKPPSAAPTNE
ncbi:MAG: Sec-independent protein translocase protein TatB [Betaproteobacteria bacterium]|nr:Sec-independent protein translocase protein TatB [Betaproteobacteria bacterium]